MFFCSNEGAVHALHGKGLVVLARDFTVQGLVRLESDKVLEFSFLVTHDIFATEIHLFRFVVAETFGLCGKEVLVKDQEIGIFAHGNGAFFVLNAQLFGAVDGIAQDHFLDAHSLLFRREYFGDDVEFGYPGLVGNPAGHPHLHTEVGVPGREILKDDVVTGPRDQCAAIPERFAAEHLPGALLAQPYRTDRRVIRVPPRSKIRNNTQFGEAVQVRIVLNLQMGAGDLHMETVSQFLFSHFHAVQNDAGRTFPNGVKVQVQIGLIELLQKRCDSLHGEGSRPCSMDICVPSMKIFMVWTFMCSVLYSRWKRFSSLKPSSTSRSALTTRQPST